MKHLLALVVVALFAIQPVYADTIKINLHSCPDTPKGSQRTLFF